MRTYPQRSRGVRFTHRLAMVTTAILIAVALGGPGAARAADCQLADFAYNGACGPEFETPAWGDGAGWTDSSKYSTIQLADLTGNGVDELIGRNDDGIEIWRFDTTLGQWRPAIDANGQPEVLRDFHSPLPSDAGPAWTQAPYYSTIQTVDLHGNGVDEIIARFPSGMRAYKYTPAAGSQSIDGGSWSLISQNGPFSDADGYTDPAMYLSIHALSAANGQPARLMAQSQSGVVVYDWNGSGWTKESANPPYSPYTADPSSYLDLQWATLSVNGKQVPAIVQRNSGGVHVQYESGGTWVQAGQQPNPGPFADGAPPSVDCPFTDADQNDQCFGSSPAYYETLRFADLDGGPGEEMLGRASDGLRVYQLTPDGTHWTRLAKLTDLGGSAFGSNPPPPGRWASIRTAAVGAGSGTQVLALDGTALQTWSYNAASGSWSKLSPTAPLQLGGEMWDNTPSYYSTILTGDITGDGHDAVIARGPFGIRTWFYDLHGNSGWTSYLPQDTSSYPQFTGGQAAAFAALTSEANVGHGSVRDLWTGENAPTTSDLTDLQQKIVGFAGCSGGSPPYATCSPPADSSGFTAADWTAVVNEVLAEIGMAIDANNFFAELESLRQETFIAEGAQLASIVGDLGLQGAAGNETTVSPKEIAASVLGIAGAIAGNVPVVGEPLATALDAASELVGLLMSDSPTLTSEFQATVADLQDKFADIITDTDKGLLVQSQEVRSNYNLMSLVAQLTTGTGAWVGPDTAGLQSTSEQGFALWVYKQLLPTLYVRYQENCSYNHAIWCNYFVAGPETIGWIPAFTTIGPPPTSGSAFTPSTPCNTTAPFGANYNSCQFEPLPIAISTKVWGPSPTRAITGQKIRLPYGPLNATSA